MTATELGLDIAPISVNGQWTAALPGFPPGADINFAIDAGFSIEGYAAQPSAPVFFNIVLQVGSDLYAFNIDNAFSVFPVWSSYQSYAPSDSTGALDLALLVWICQGPTLPIDAPLPICTIDGTSTFEATLVDTTPWLEAPICGQ